MKIEELGLSARAYNTLKRARIDTVEEIKRMSDDQLLKLRCMGAGTLREIRELTDDIPESDYARAAGLLRIEAARSSCYKLEYIDALKLAVEALEQKERENGGVTDGGR